MRRKGWMGAALAAVVVLSLFYARFASRQIYRESVSRLEEVYGQVNAALRSTISKNWRLLRSWQPYIAAETDPAALADFLLEEGEALVTGRPFRSPHHTISQAALIGGSTAPKPGMISLAHRGVLFLDELPEFQRASLDALRQPLEERRVTISRVSGNVTYPSDFMLVCAMNPCPCGYYPDRARCSCTRPQVHRYMGKVSGPILDRMDYI